MKPEAVSVPIILPVSLLTSIKPIPQALAIMASGTPTVHAYRIVAHKGAFPASHPRRSETVKEFFQTKNESVVINGEITVTVADIVGDQVMLAIDAPGWMRVYESDKVEVGSAR